MISEWKTAAIDFRGGMNTSKTDLSLGEEIPGGARNLENLEPSTFGGYACMEGFRAYGGRIPIYGLPRVTVSGQSGTSLIIGNLHEAPTAGDTFTIAGVAGTYTISSLVYSPSGRYATLTLTTSLDSSPSDKALITFTSGTSIVQGVSFFNGKVYVVSGGVILSSTGGAWGLVNIPTYGTVLVKGSGQSGTTLVIDGIDDDAYKPSQGDAFTIAGIEGIYNVTAAGLSSAGEQTILIYPSLQSSPTDNAAVTFLSSSFFDATKSTFVKYNFDGTVRLLVTHSSYSPGVIGKDGSYSSILDLAARSANDAKDYKDHMFFAQNDLLNFSVPFDETNFDTASGAGAFRFPGVITGLAVFRNDLIVFTSDTTHRVTGTSSADFAITSISGQTGCISKDTVKEVSGDLMYLRQDGLSFLGATERNNDFTLANPSAPIQKDLVSRLGLDNTPNYCAVVSRQKNTYRLFRYLSGEANADAFSAVGTQLKPQDPESFVWGLGKGVNAFRANSGVDGTTERTFFTLDDNYVYEIRKGRYNYEYTSGVVAIAKKLYTPFFSFGLPRRRKYIRRVTLIGREVEYNSLNITCTPVYDLGNTNIIQPAAITGAVSTFNDRFEIVFNTTGSGFNVSFEFDISSSGGVLDFDTLLVEYTEEERR